MTASPDYTEVTRLVRAAFAEYKRIDSDGNRDTFADFVDEVTGDEASRFVEQRVELWPPSEAKFHAQRVINLHRALGAEIASLTGLLPEPKAAPPAFHAQVLMSIVCLDPGCPHRGHQTCPHAAHHFDPR